MSTVKSQTYLFIITLIFFGNVEADIRNTDLLGSWLGERIDDGQTIKWLTQRVDVNRYGILFLVCEGSQTAWIQKEYGEWSYEDGMYKTVTRLIEDSNGKREPNTPTKTYVEHYTDVLISDKGELTYRHRDKDKSYRLVKVPDGYRISCS